MRHWLVGLTLVLLLAATILAAVWVCVRPDFDSTITLLVLLATITGLVISRWLAERERRRDLLYAVVHELSMNLRALNDLSPPAGLPAGQPYVFPRFYASSLQAAIGSGAFSGGKDRQLFKLMHQWLQRVLELNRRIDITEMETLRSPQRLEEFVRLMSSGRTLPHIKQALFELTDHLMKHYAKESGIGFETPLFPEGTE